MSYQIVSSNYPEGLTKKVNELEKEGWIPVGGHSVVVTHIQNRYSGSQHMDSQYKHEYTQTMVKSKERLPLSPI